MKSPEKAIALPKQKQVSLGFCVLMDVLGCLPYLLPVLGEAFDFVWAPIAAFLFWRSFGGKIGSFGAAITFVEELLPFTDFIPTFTIAWLLKNKMGRWF